MSARSRRASLGAARFALAAVAAALAVATGPAAAQAPARSAELAQLEQLVDGYERQLARVKSVDAIENLQSAYGYYVDKAMWSQAADLFADDATWEYGQRGVYVGRTRIRRALGLAGREGLRHGQLNNYMMLQPLITVADDNRTAKARWRSNMQLAANGKGQWGEGVYENDYVNDRGTWKISRLRFFVTALADYSLGWAEGAIPMEGPSREFPPDRPPTEVYESLPGVHVPRYHFRHPVTGRELAP